MDQREKELIQENARIKKQLAAAQEEKRILLGRLHEIEAQLNAVASNLPPSTDLDGLAERFKKPGYSPVVVLPWKHALSFGRMGDAQRLLRIDEEAPLKDQKIALLEQRGLSHQNGFLPDTDTATDTYYLSEAGRSWKTEIELEVAGGIGVGSFSLRIFGRRITPL